MSDEHVCSECAWLDYGDFVESKLNTNVCGMVIGRMGSIVLVQLSPSLAVQGFQECTLRLVVDDDEYTEPQGGEEVPAREDNVVDFTKARELRANTKTKGVA